MVVFRMTRTEDEAVLKMIVEEWQPAFRMVGRWGEVVLGKMIGEGVQVSRRDNKEAVTSGEIHRCI